MAPDFVSSLNGSTVLLTPLTPAASDWLDENIAGESEFFGGSLAVESRFFFDIACGLLSDGLTMQDGSTGCMATLPTLH